MYFGGGYYYGGCRQRRFIPSMEAIVHDALISCAKDTGCSGVSEAQIVQHIFAKYGIFTAQANITASLEKLKITKTANGLYTYISNESTNTAIDKIQERERIRQRIYDEYDDHSSLSSIPIEIFVYIFSFFHSNSLAAIQLVCKKWHAIIRSDDTMPLDFKVTQGNIQHFQRVMSQYAGRVRTLDISFDLGRQHGVRYFDRESGEVIKAIKDNASTLQHLYLRSVSSYSYQTEILFKDMPPLPLLRSFEINYSNYSASLEDIPDLRQFIFSLLDNPAKCLRVLKIKDVQMSRETLHSIIKSPVAPLLRSFGYKQNVDDLVESAPLAPQFFESVRELHFAELPSSLSLQAIVGVFHNLEAVEIEGMSNTFCYTAIQPTFRLNAPESLKSFSISSFYMRYGAVSPMIIIGPNLERLKVTSCSLSLLDISNCPRLTEVSIYYCRGLTSIEFPDDLSRLRSFNLTNSEHIRDISALSRATALEELVLSNFNTLRTVTIDFSSHTAMKRFSLVRSTLDDGTFEHIEPWFKSFGAGLEEVNVQGCWQMTDRQVKAINEYCPNLKVLNLSNCGHLKEVVLQQPNLEKLPLEGTFSVTSISLSGCTTLEILELSSLSLLSRLSLENCYKLTRLNVVFAAKPKLKIKNCPRIKHLACQSRDMSSYFTAATIKKFATASGANLESLTLDFFQLDTNALTAIITAWGSTLKNLELFGCITDGSKESATILGKLAYNNLTKLSLGSRQDDFVVEAPFFSAFIKSALAQKHAKSSSGAASDKSKKKAAQQKAKNPATREKSEENSSSSSSNNNDAKPSCSLQQLELHRCVYLTDSIVKQMVDVFVPGLKQLSIKGFGKTTRKGIDLLNERLLADSTKDGGNITTCTQVLREWARMTSAALLKKRAEALKSDDDAYVGKEEKEKSDEAKSATATATANKASLKKDESEDDEQEEPEEEPEDEEQEESEEKEEEAEEQEEEQPKKRGKRKATAAASAAAAKKKTAEIATPKSSNSSTKKTTTAAKEKTTTGKASGSSSNNNKRKRDDDSSSSSSNTAEAGTSSTTTRRVTRSSRRSAAAAAKK